MEEKQEKTTDVVYSVIRERQIFRIPGSAFPCNNNTDFLGINESFSIVPKWPESGEHKVVQLEIDLEPYLLFYGGLHEEWMVMDDHFILKDFLKSKGVDYKGFEVQNERCVFHAVGISSIDFEHKQALFYSNSGRYCIGSSGSRAHFRSIEDKIGDWKLTYS